MLATFNLVAGVADGQPGSLRAAITAANANGENDIINLAAGTYSLTLSGQNEDNNANGDLDIKEVGRSLTIRGAGADVTIISGASVDRILHVHPGATLVLEDVTVRGGSVGTSGGGLLNQNSGVNPGTVTINRVIFTQNVAAGSAFPGETDPGGGGAIANFGGQMTLNNVTITANNTTGTTASGGGVYVAAGTVQAFNTTISNNTSRRGGGVYAASPFHATDSLITTNTANGTTVATGGGGGMMVDGPTVNLTRTTITDNNTTSSIGGLGTFDTFGGGGLFILGGRANLIESSVLANRSGRGSGIHLNGGTVDLLRSTIANNANGTGSALNSTFGGAIYNNGGRIYMTNATMSGNIAQNTGGIFNDGGNIYISFSTITANNSTGNTATTPAGDSYNIPGGILTGGGRVFLDNSILALNTRGATEANWRGDVISRGYNLFGLITADTRFDFRSATTGDMLNSNPLLGPLQNNGGPTMTREPLAGSPALNSGNNSGALTVPITGDGAPPAATPAPATDQRGVNRPQAGTVDRGAVEFQVPNTPPVANAGGPYVIFFGSPLVLNGSGSSDADPGDSIQMYQWDIDNNGQYDDATGPTPTFSWAQLQSLGLASPGTRTVGLRVTDTQGASSTATTTFTISAATIAGRRVFYNNSMFDGGNPAANAADDGAIAPDKQALLPGQTATTAHYTNYSRGLNGVMIDIAGAANLAILNAADFQFLVGNSNNLNEWSLAPNPQSITVRPGAGAGGSDRITIIWADGAIQKKWLRVELKANAKTALQGADVFYFGNAVGDTYNGDTAVTGGDFLGARDNPRTFFNQAPITFAYDFNRDGLVNSGDLTIVRDNTTTFQSKLVLITAPAGGSFGEGEGEGEAEGEGESAFAWSPAPSDVLLSAESPDNDPLTLAIDDADEPLSERAGDDALALAWLFSSNGKPASGDSLSDDGDDDDRWESLLELLAEQHAALRG